MSKLLLAPEKIAASSCDMTEQVAESSYDMTELSTLILVTRSGRTRGGYLEQRLVFNCTLNKSEMFRKFAHASHEYNHRLLSGF